MQKRGKEKTTGPERLCGSQKDQPEQIRFVCQEAPPICLFLKILWWLTSIVCLLSCT